MAARTRSRDAIDDTAKAIIEQLQADGRRSYAAIGQAVGLSEAAVRQRVQKLVDGDVMQIVAVTDPMQLGFARQAMIAGMCHFASQSGTTLIAEGIETEAEASMLRQLGVPLGEAGMLGQGYLFGKPSMFT